jgi:nucleoside-diphosphate-sugar epimerase
MRLDLTVNLLTSQAYHERRMRVFGGDQMRPNIHIDDVCDLYVQSLNWAESEVDGKIFNAGYQNSSVREIAEMIRRATGNHVSILVEPTNDHRSYRISSERIKRDLGFVPKRTLEQAASEILGAFQAGRIPNAMSDLRYYNVKMMKALDLK